MYHGVNINRRRIGKRHDHTRTRTDIQILYGHVQDLWQQFTALRDATAEELTKQREAIDELHSILTEIHTDWKDRLEAQIMRHNER